MPQHPPAHDETVRMRGDGPSGRPTLEGQRVTPPAPSTATDTALPTGHTPVHAQAAAQSAPPAAVPESEFDDTRPVGRDWLQGAPEATEAHARTEPGDATAIVSSQPLGDQEYATQQFDRVGPRTRPRSTACPATRHGRTTPSTARTRSRTPTATGPTRPAVPRPATSRPPVAPAARGGAARPS